MREVVLIRRAGVSVSEREQGVTSRWREWCVLVRCVDAPVEEAIDRSMYRKQEWIFSFFCRGRLAARTGRERTMSTTNVSSFMLRR